MSAQLHQTLEAPPKMGKITGCVRNEREGLRQQSTPERRIINSSSEYTKSEGKQRRSSEPTVGNRWRGCVALIAGFFQQTLCWGMIMTFGSILTFYTRHLLPTTSKKALSLVGVLPAFLVMVMSLLWGRLLDAGHHRKINTFSGICLTAGLTGLAFTGGSGSYGSGHYWQILLASVPIGIGQSCYFIAAPHMAKTWYPKHKGFAMGVTNGGSAVGGVLWPLIFTEMTARYSFRTGIGTLAAISCILGIFIVCASTPAPSFQRRPIGPATRLRTWLPTRGFRSKVFIIHICAMCSVYSGVLTVPFFIEYWAQQNGIGIPEDVKTGKGMIDRAGPLTVYLVVILNACQLPGRLLGSTLCDKVQARRIHIVSCLTAILILLPFWYKSKTFTQGCVFAAVFGLVLGVTVSLPINDVADILGPKRIHLLGQYAGVVYTIAAPFTLGGSVISGVIVDELHSYAVVIWVVCCFGVCALLLMLGLAIQDDTWKLDDGHLAQANDQRSAGGGTMNCGADQC